jgi:hypothetical protein
MAKAIITLTALTGMFWFQVAPQAPSYCVDGAVSAATYNRIVEIQAGKTREIAVNVANVQRLCRFAAEFPR